MGAERLIRASLAALLLAAFCGACGGERGIRPPPVAPSAGSRHVEIVHAMKTSARRELVSRFRERNPTPSGGTWTVNEEALAQSLTVVDPFAGFVRRARRKPFERPPPASGPIGEEQAAASARAFVKRNADLLGIPHQVVLGLLEHVRAVGPLDHASSRAKWAVRFDAPFSTRGYEGFKELDDSADVEVFVDDDGEVSSFVNVSRIHPLLTIDTKPRLSREDPRVLAKIVGRRLFALEGHDPGPDGEPRDLAGVQALRRIPVGEARPEDVDYMQLVVHESTGPELAWLTYRLAYFVELARPAPAELFPDEPGTRYFFFRYVVDADTGEVLEDARAPFASSAVARP